MQTIEGIECEELSVEDTGIEPGQMYMAQRNAGWKLLTCKMYHRYDPKTCEQHYRQAEMARRDHDDSRPYVCGLVWPEENAYPYNDFECYKVKEG